jgi:ankyrin repeat protein
MKIIRENGSEDRYFLLPQTLSRANVAALDAILSAFRFRDPYLLGSRTFDEALMAAVRQGNMPLARCLLNASVNDGLPASLIPVYQRLTGEHLYWHVNEETPLNTALYAGQVDVARELLKHWETHVQTYEPPEATGRKPTIRDALGAPERTDICVAISTGRIAPLHIAAQQGYTTIVEQLLDLGAKINVTDAGGRTPLHRATLAGQRETARILVARGADNSLRTTAGNSVADCERIAAYESEVTEDLVYGFQNRILQATLYELPSWIREMAAEGANLEARIGWVQWTHLHLAAHEGCYNSVKTLVLGGADVRALDIDGRTPADVAVRTEGVMAALLRAEQLVEKGLEPMSKGQAFRDMFADLDAIFEAEEGESAAMTASEYARKNRPDNPITDKNETCPLTGTYELHEIMDRMKAEGHGENKLKVVKDLLAMLEGAEKKSNSNDCHDVPKLPKPEEPSPSGQRVPNEPQGSSLWTQISPTESTKPPSTAQEIPPEIQSGNERPSAITTSSPEVETKAPGNNKISKWKTFFKSKGNKVSS